MRIPELPNLGPKSQQMLAEAGVTSLEQLRALGAVAAYALVKRCGGKPSLNLLWALEGALTGLPWQQVAREHRTSLLLALEHHERSSDQALPDLGDLLPRTSGNTVVRLLRETDLGRFHAYRSDERLARFQGWSPMTVGEARSFLLEMSRVRALIPGDWIQLAIADNASGTLIGDLGLFLDAGLQWAELGFTLSHAAQGQGHATRAARAAVNLVFAATPVGEVRASTDARNGASLRVLERIGFRLVARQETIFKGEPCTELAYARRRS